MGKQPSRWWRFLVKFFQGWVGFQANPSRGMLRIEFFHFGCPDMIGYDGQREVACQPETLVEWLWSKLNSIGRNWIPITLRSSNMAGWESPNNWGFHWNIIYKWGLSIAMFDYWRLVGCLVTFWKRFYHWKSMCASWKLHIMAIMVKQSSGNATENHHWHWHNR